MNFISIAVLESPRELYTSFFAYQSTLDVLDIKYKAHHCSVHTIIMSDFDCPYAKFTVPLTERASTSASEPSILRDPAIDLPGRRLTHPGPASKI